MKNDAYYDVCSAAEYYAAVVGKQDHEAVYYLLKNRLRNALHHVFELHGFGLGEEYDDTLDEFFLYLYEGNGRYEQRPFAMIESIRNTKAFFAWVVSVYRLFLLNRAKDEVRRRELLERAKVVSGDGEPRFSEETLVRFMATAIAYSDQELDSPKLFIFYRMVLTILDHGLAIPQEKVAQAIGMPPVSYRVFVNRLRNRLAGHVLVLEGGGTLPLDAAHQRMADRLYNDFDRLYEVLMACYQEVLEALPSSEAMKALRNSYSEELGMAMHEPCRYGLRHFMDVRTLYHSLSLRETVLEPEPTRQPNSGPSVQ